MCHVAAAAERRLEFLEDEEDFAVVISRLMLRLDVNRPDLAAVLAGAEIGAGAIVRVIEAESRRPRREGDAPHAVRGMNGVPFFGRAVDIGGTNWPCQCSCSGVSVSL